MSIQISLTAGPPMDRLKLVVQYLDSNDPRLVSCGLNYLTQKSVESAADWAASVVPPSLQIDQCPTLPTALGSLLDTINPLAHFLFRPSTSNEEYMAICLNNVNKFEWPRSLPSRRHAEFKLLALSIDENTFLLTILNIFRNTSFEAANEFAIASSTCFLRHLLTSILASLESGGNEAGAMALETITNIAGRIDTTGKKRLHHMHHLEDLSSVFGLDERGKSLFKMRLSHQYSSSSLPEYSSAISMLLSILYHIFTRRADMPNITYLTRALEITSKLALNPDNASCFQGCPRELLAAVADFLSPSELKELPSYGPNSVNVTLFELELRNLAIEALQNICNLSPVAMSLVGSVPNCIDTIYGIATLPSFVASISGAANPNPNPNYPSSYIGGETSHYNVSSSVSKLHHLASVKIHGINTSGVSTSPNLSYSNANSSANVNTVIFSKVAEGSHKAAQLLGLLLSQKEFSEKFRGLRTDLYLAACGDEFMADMVCNKLYSTQSNIFFGRDVGDVQGGVITTLG